MSRHAGRLRHWGLVGLLLAALGVALAGGMVAMQASGGQEAEAGPDPLLGPDYYASSEAVCALLDARDLELALGYQYSQGFEPPVTHPVFATVPAVTRCTYVQEQRREDVSLGIVYAYAQQVFDDAVAHAEELGETQQVTIPGPATRAVWTTTPRQLLVLTDGKVVLLTVPAMPREGDQVEAARRLAARVLGRLR